MTDDQNTAQIALAFLQRVTLQPNEIQAFQHVTTLLGNIVNGYTEVSRVEVEVSNEEDI